MIEKELMKRQQTQLHDFLTNWENPLLIATKTEGNAEFAYRIEFCNPKMADFGVDIVDYQELLTAKLFSLHQKDKIASDSDAAVDDDDQRSVHEILVQPNNLQNFATVTKGPLAGKQVHISGQ